MAINFLDSEILYASKGNPQKHTTETTALTTPVLKAVTTSADVSGIELRMLPPFIKDNHTLKLFPFSGYAKLYCLTIVVSDTPNQLVGAIDLTGFPRIGDQEALPINKTIFYWQAASDQNKSPNQIHVLCSVVKSKRSLRDTAKILSSVKSDGDYKTLLDRLSSVVKEAEPFNVVTDAIVQVAGIVGKYLDNVEDKPLGTVINSYTTLFGDFDQVGVIPHAYTTTKVDFNFQLVVRSKAHDAIHSTKGTTNTGNFTQEKVRVDMVPL